MLLVSNPSSLEAISILRQTGTCRGGTLLEVETGHYYPKIQDG